MKKFVYFPQAGGTDSYHVLDGRLNMDNCIAEGYRQVDLLRNIKPFLSIMEIHSGNLRVSTVLKRITFKSHDQKQAESTAAKSGQ